ncbi:acyl-CoA dehydrogenase [Bradyrhizobium barranii subsp. barranii]
MDFSLPADLVAYLGELDRFIEREIKPLEQADDNIRFFDHRREWARTDFENGGLPRHEWEALLRKAKDLADAAGHLRFPVPKQYGGKDGSNLWMAVIREHFAAKGLGLHNDLQNEHSIVGNFPVVTMLDRYGRDDQKAMIDGSIKGKYRITFGLTEPHHGSDATHMETRAVPATRDNVKGWIINGEKMWTTGMHVATHCALFARTSGNDGDARGITCFLVPAKSHGVKVEEYMWTFNMPTDHPRVSFTDVFVPEDALFGEFGRGLSLAQCFVHQNRIRQAASSLGAAVYCIKRECQIRARAKAVRQGARREPGDPVPAGRARDPSRDAAPVDPQDRLGDGPAQRGTDRAHALRPRLHVQLLGKPPLLRIRRPCHAGPRRHGLFTPQAVRAHLPPPPPLSDHGGE